jgi:hypothetical protein
MKKLILAALLLCAIGAGTFWFKYSDWVTLPRARQQVSDQLSDPSSTQFRNDRLVSSGWHCGELNAKNGMGGYVGFKRFISGGQNAIFYVEGHGQLGKESHEEFMAVMEKRIAYMKEINALRAQLPDLAMPSEAEQYTKARSDVFEDHWKSICEQK